MTFVAATDSESSLASRTSPGDERTGLHSHSVRATPVGAWTSGPEARPTPT